MMLLLAAAITGCIGFDGDIIRMSDFARVLPAFSVAPPEAPAGFAPTFGAKRTFSATDVSRFAARFGVTLSSSGPLCFERQSTNLDAAAVQTSIGQAIGDESVQFKVVDFAHYAVPSGEVIFHRTGLQRTPASDGTRLWQGKVVFGNHRSVAIWARVAISCSREVPIAVRDLAAGQTVTTDDVRLDTIEVDPFAPSAAARLEDVVGKVVRSRVPSGKSIPVSLLSAAPVVHRGEDVDVTVFSGQARLKLAGKAQKQGRTGDVIPVRNPVSGRMFQAKVEGRGHVVVGGTSAKKN
ncbi:MAG: flagellar basal body P-ring formation chaperone FlgA [Bryobacteraceae bacterium]